MSCINQVPIARWCSQMQVGLDSRAVVLFQERNVVALPLKNGRKHADHVVTLQVLRRFEFEAALMRSGVVAVDTDDPDTGLLFVRGAPSIVEQLIRGGQIPANYRQVSEYRPIIVCENQTACCGVTDWTAVVAAQN